MYKNKSKTVHNCTLKTVIGVSKKHNSIWRVYGYDYNEDDNLVLVAKKINPLLVWFYKSQKQKLCNNICDICFKEFRFYKSRFESMPNECYDCNPVQLHDDSVY